ncbi:MAG: alpha-methylacyl-CoA racemase [Thermodesulfobacteriota bacterium]|nr:alpha-methylacyl-CoA racemase [Thermodesulfobacteriota bacterium]
MSQALSGVRILDLSMNLPGPYMTWLLALMGAEILKVENPAGGDYARVLGGGKNTPYFEAVNRNKKSLTLNLKHPEGQRLFHKLLSVYDIVVEGFRPGTMAQFGLDFASLSPNYPRLIYVSISGYGQDGPYRSRAGHDINYLALAGILGMTGSREGDPALPGIQIADLAGGSLMALCGLLAAIIQREKTGKGQFVDTSMFHGSLSLATMVFAGIDQGLEQPLPGKMLLNGRFPCYGLYRTADGSYMSLGALEFKFWESFCRATGREDLIAKQFGGPEIIAEVAQIFCGRNREEWIELMRDADACCEPVLALDEAVSSPAANTFGMVKHMEDGKRFLSTPLRLSNSPVPKDIPAPSLGQHSREVLREIGLTATDCEELSRQGVI